MAARKREDDEEEENLSKSIWSHSKVKGIFERVHLEGGEMASQACWGKKFQARGTNQVKERMQPFKRKGRLWDSRGRLKVMGKDIWWELRGGRSGGAKAMGRFEGQAKDPGVQRQPMEGQEEMHLNGKGGRGFWQQRAENRITEAQKGEGGCNS